VADTAFEVLIIGSGPGGYMAAARVAHFGVGTAVAGRV